MFLRNAKGKAKQVITFLLKKKTRGSKLLKPISKFPNFQISKFPNLHFYISPFPRSVLLPPVLLPPQEPTKTFNPSFPPFTISILPNLHFSHLLNLRFGFPECISTMLGFLPLLLLIPTRRRNLSLSSSIPSTILIALMILILFIPLSNGSPLLTCQYFPFSLILIRLLISFAFQSLFTSSSSLSYFFNFVCFFLFFLGLASLIL